MPLSFPEHTSSRITRRNRDERLWATVLVGPQGFASSSDPLLLTVKPLRQFKGDAAEFRVGEYIASTAIVLETRQRERLNGRVTAHCDLCLSVSVSQSFGSCPKYIQGDFAVPTLHRYRVNCFCQHKISKGRHCVSLCRSVILRPIVKYTSDRLKSIKGLSETTF